MNSIIWKGVSSTTIKGLIINELPPISKPELRVMETVIDGRNGSVIEDLGYNPYDKPLVISLFGNFNINEVIKYFTGEGEVVFSNEPDKVYRAKIFSQIDYNRLLRYRQATIVFRTQPFKYAFNEELSATETGSASGTSIVINDGASAIIKNLIVGDGSATEGQVEIQTTGKNMLPYPYFETTKIHGGIQYTVDYDGSVKVKGTAGSYSLLVLDKTVKFIDGETYTIGGGTENTSVVICYDDANGSRQYVSGNFTWSNKYTLVQLHIVVREGRTVDETIYPMLEKGLSTSEFEPYKKSSATYDYATNTLNGTVQTFEPNTIIINSENVPMAVEYFKPFEVINKGLETSRPKMTITGNGTVEIKVNGVGIFSYTFPEGENQVVIDSEIEDAYLGNVLKNRNMNGEFPVLQPGINKIEWSGDIESIEIEPRSRWL